MSTKTEKLKDRILDCYKKYKPGMDDLQSERTEAYKYLYGEARGDEVEGRSQVVSKDLYELTTWIMVDMVRIFLSGNNVVETRPRGKEDVMVSKLVEELIRYDFFELNKGYKIVIDALLDSFVCRIGVIKYYWHRKYNYSVRKFYNITETEMSLLMSEQIQTLDDSGATEQKYVFDEIKQVKEGIPGFTESAYNIKIREKERLSYPKIECIKPEDISFNRDMQDREDVDGVIIQRIKVHKNKLKEYGFGDDVNDYLEKCYEGQSEEQSRFADLGGITYLTDDAKSDFVYMYECYLYDYDDNGEPVPKIAHIVGDRIGLIQDNLYGKPNFAFISPYLLAHRMMGLSLYNISDDIQDVNTVFLRMILDNGYYQNNTNRIVNQHRVDMTNMSEGMKPGVILTMLHDGDPNTCIANVPAPQLSQSVLNTYQKIMPEVKAGRTGINKFMQGLDPKAIANRTSTGVSQQMSASQGPREYVARCIAETGMRDLFQGILDMYSLFFDMERAVYINKDWVTVTPEMLKGKRDVVIDVGVGTGTKYEAYGKLMGMLDRYGMIANVAGPMTPEIFNIEHIKNILREGWELIGFKNTDRFVNGEGPQQPMMPPGTPGMPGMPGTPGMPGMKPPMQPPMQPSMPEMMPGMMQNV